MYFDKQGYEIDFDTWKRLLQVDGYKDIAEDRVGDCIIRTVWLGVSTGVGAIGAGGIKIFETTIFGGALDGAEQKYSTIGEAQSGHRSMVRKIERYLMFGTLDD